MQIFLFSFFFLSFLLEVGNKDALSRQEFHELPSFLSSRRGKVKLIRSFEQRINSVDDFSYRENEDSCLRSVLN